MKLFKSTLIRVLIATLAVAALVAGAIAPVSWGG